MMFRKKKKLTCLEAMKFECKYSESLLICLYDDDDVIHITLNGEPIVSNPGSLSASKQTSLYRG